MWGASPVRGRRASSPRKTVETERSFRVRLIRHLTALVPSTQAFSAFKPTCTFQWPLFTQLSPSEKTALVAQPSTNRQASLAPFPAGSFVPNPCIKLRRPIPRAGRRASSGALSLDAFGRLSSSRGGP